MANDRFIWLMIVHDKHDWAFLEAIGFQRSKNGNYFLRCADREAAIATKRALVAREITGYHCHKVIDTRRDPRAAPYQPRNNGIAAAGQRSGNGRFGRRRRRD